MKKSSSGERKTRNQYDKGQKSYYSKNTLYAFGAVIIVILIVVAVAVLFFYVSEPSAPACGSMPGSSSAFVINGTEVNTHEFPFYVSIKLRRQRGSFCGASIIAPNWVLTAKHCVYTDDVVMMCKNIMTDLESNCLQVVAGAMETVNKGEGSVHDVITISTLKADKMLDFSEDIALLYVEPPFEYKLSSKNSRGVTSVCLPENDEAVPEKKLDLVGFGIISEFHRISATKLMTAKLNNVEVAECLKPLLPDNITMADIQESPEYAEAQKRFVCTADIRENRDACNGDSGGPLTVLRRNKVVQVGLVSFGPATGCGDKSTMFVSVAYYREWIQKISGV